MAVHVADFDEPGLGGPAVGGGWMFVEHRGGVVDFRAAVFALVGDEALDGGAHPCGFLRTVGLQLGDPPIFVGIFVVAKFIDRHLRPMAFVLCIRSQAELERSHVSHATSALGSRWQAV